MCSLAHPTVAHTTTLTRLANHQVHLLTMSHRMDSDSDDIETYQTPCLCQLKVTHRLTKMLDKTTSVGMTGVGEARWDGEKELGTDAKNPVVTETARPA